MAKTSRRRRPTPDRSRNAVDRPRELGAPPGQGRRAGLLADQLGALDALRRRSGRPRTGCSGSSSSRLATISVGTDSCSSATRRRTRVERGTTRERVRDRLRVAVAHDPLPDRLHDQPSEPRLHRRIAVDAHEAIHAVALEPVGERVPARQLRRVRLRQPRCAGVICTSAATRSGCSSANASVVAAPIDAPASTTRSSPRSSSTARGRRPGRRTRMRPDRARGSSRRARARRRRSRGSRRAPGRASRARRSGASPSGRGRARAAALRGRRPPPRRRSDDAAASARRGLGSADRLPAEAWTRSRASCARGRSPRR